MDAQPSCHARCICAIVKGWLSHCLKHQAFRLLASRRGRGCQQGLASGLSSSLARGRLGFCASQLYWDIGTARRSWVKPVAFWASARQTTRTLTLRRYRIDNRGPHELRTEQFCLVIFLRQERWPLKSWAKQVNCNDVMSINELGGLRIVIEN